MNNIYISTLSLIISIAALGVAFFNYRRSLKLQNENIIYSKKIEAYIEFSSHLWTLITKNEEIGDLVKEKPKVIIPKVEKLIDELEIFEDKFNAVVIKYALISDEKIVDLLMNLSSKNEFVYDYNSYSKEKIDVSLNSFIEKVDVIFDKMEEDLAIPNLSKGLASRIKSIPVKKDRKKNI